MIAIAIAWFLLGLLASGQPVHGRTAAARGDHLVAGTGGQRARAGGRPTGAGTGQCRRQQHRQPGLDPGGGGDCRTPAAARAPADGAVVVAAGDRRPADPVRAGWSPGALGRWRTGGGLHRRAGTAAAPRPCRERRGAGGHRRIRAQPHQPAVERAAGADCGADAV
uniref:Uncharacterized protein n=1 Tax=Panagrolaimus superbus TaxID=310955 RepID=A0A914Y8W6_9BILA